MKEKQLKFKDNQNKGLGYHSVPPPFNDNYTPPLEINEDEILAQYGPPPVPALVKTEPSRPTKNIEMTDTNDSTSCAGKVVEDENKENIINSSSVDSVDCQTNVSLNSEFVASNSVTLNQPVVGKYRPPKQAKQSACCKCACV